MTVGRPTVAKEAQLSSRFASISSFGSIGTTAVTVAAVVVISSLDIITAGNWDSPSTRGCCYSTLRTCSSSAQH